MFSGRGNGSRHYYVLTDEPFKCSTPRKSADWEVALYSDGRQVVLPPSIHPDTGNAYVWGNPSMHTGKLPLVSFKLSGSSSSASNEGRSPFSETAPLEDFKVESVELAWLPISDSIRAGIQDGTGVTDRSGYLLKASSALFSAGLSENEVLSVLTDKKNFLSGCAYEHAQTTSRKRAAQWLHRYTVKRVAKERSPAVFSGAAVVAAKKLSQEEQEKQSAELEEERSWRQDLICTQQGVPMKLIQNVVTVIENAVAADVIKRNEFACRDTYSQKTPWGGKKNDVVCDDDVDEIRYWLGKHFKFEPPENIVSSALVVIARRNAYDPVKEMLESLPEWDGVDRLDSWLSENFEAEGHPAYLAQVFRKWMVAMVMRVYEPGAKFDWMPIFEGAQGVGKSSFGKILVGEKYFLDWLPNLHDKDAALSLQGMWGVEMGELSQFRRNELETIKAFLTRTVDKMRPPYGRRSHREPASLRVLRHNEPRNLSDRRDRQSKIQTRHRR